MLLQAVTITSSAAGFQVCVSREVSALPGPGRRGFFSAPGRPAVTPTWGLTDRPAAGGQQALPGSARARSFGRAESTERGKGMLTAAPLGDAQEILHAERSSQAWAWGGTHGGRSVSVAGVGDEQPQYLVCPPAGGSFVRNNHTELRQSRRGREPQVGPPLGQKAWLGAQVDRLPRAVAQDRRPNLSVPQHPSCRAGGGTSSPRNSECSAGPRSVSTGYLPWRFSSLSR